MNNKEVINNHSLSKKTGNLIIVQTILAAAALFISLYGIIASLEMASSTYRIVVYVLQAAVCLAMAVFGAGYLKKMDAKYFKGIVLAYALLEAVRVSLLQTGGIGAIYSAMAKFVLVLLVLAASLLSERLEKKESVYLAFAMLALEILLYLVFLVGFPDVRTKLLFIVAPLVGIFMSASVSVFVKARWEQITHSKN